MPSKSTWVWIAHASICFEVREVGESSEHRHVWQLGADREVVCECGKRGTITGNFFTATRSKQMFIRAITRARDWPVLGRVATALARRIRVKYYFNPVNPPNLGWGDIEVFEVSQ